MSDKSKAPETTLEYDGETKVPTTPAELDRLLGEALQLAELQDPWKDAFMLVASWIKRQFAKTDDYTYEVVYAYMQGVSQNHGVDIPDIRG